MQQIDISETSIAKHALDRRGISVGDTYKVKLQMLERRTKSGDIKSEFTVKEVMEFIPGQRRTQTEMQVDGI